MLITVCRQCRRVLSVYAADGRRSMYVAHGACPDGPCLDQHLATRGMAPEDVAGDKLAARLSSIRSEARRLRSDASRVLIIDGREGEAAQLAAQADQLEQQAAEIEAEGGDA